MLFQNIYYISEDFKAVKGFVGTEGARITYLGENAPTAPESFGRAVDGRGRLLIPGLYNAHSHTSMGLLRGYGENMTLQDWLTKKIFPFEDQLTDEDVYWSTMLCSLEMLRFGIVSTTDMYMHALPIAEAFRDSGVKANSAICATVPSGAAYVGSVRHQEALSVIRDFHGMDDGRILIDLALHAEYTTSERLVREVAEEAARLGKCRMQIHVSETASEVEGCRERHNGKSPVEYLKDCGLFDIPTTAAHCVHLSPADIAILKEKGVTVATCPKSNLKLASGVCPVQELLDAGVNVALATDSVSSNNNLNMLGEMQLFALLHKGISGDPTRISPKEALYAATRAGALSQGREDAGIIREGNRADLVMLDITGAHWQPVHDLMNNLVYSADGGDILMTVVDGKVCYENGEWPGLDSEKIFAEVERSRQRILKALA